MRKIIHCDADCFFAAVEMRDQPAYRGVPLAVGGLAHQRGVIATCNYEARAYGVRSAMPTLRALKLCPQLIVVAPDFARYKAASHAIFEIYRRYTDRIEPLSLDEAYLDVTHATTHQGSATLIAQEIRARVAQETGLTVSAGVAPNKFLAKIASDWHKPNGLCVIRPQDVDEFVLQLPVERIFGVGPKTAEKLHRLGIRTCEDVRRHELPLLQTHFGKMGWILYQCARGIDQREVRPNAARKSVSVETTFAQDLGSEDALIAALLPLLQDLEARIHRAQVANRIRRVFIKIRWANWHVRSFELTQSQYSLDSFVNLVQSAWRTNPSPVRLLGLGVRLHPPEPTLQLNLL